MVPLGSQVTEQLNQLGVSPEVLGDRLARLQRTPVDALTALSVAYADAAWAPGAGKFATEVDDGRVGIAPAWSNMTPTEALGARARYVYRTYHRDRVPRHPSGRRLSGLSGRRSSGTKMVRALHRDPVLRQSFEHSTSMQVVRDGRMDGTVSVSAMTAGRSATQTTPGLTGNLYEHLGAMDAAIIEYAKTLGVYASTDPDVFFGEGDDLEFMGDKWQQYGVNSPSTTGVFGFTEAGQPVPQTPENGDQSQGIDTRILQLKRMMDKRSQMYDMIRTIFDKYNEAARTSINNMKA